MSSADSHITPALPSLYNNKKFLVIMTVVIVALVVDASFIRIIDLVTTQISSTLRILLFLVTSSSLIAGQFYILKLLKFKGKIAQESILPVQKLFRIVIIVQCIQVTVFAILIFQLISSSIYNTLLLFIITTFSYSLAILILILLTHRFLVWFKARRTYEILLYGLASAAIAISIMFALGFLELMTLRAPNVISEFLGTEHMLLPTGSAISISRAMYTLFSVVSFIMTWAATFILLRYYSKKIGQVPYYIIISSPLVYFLSQFIVPFNALAPSLKLDPVLFALALTLIFNLSKTAGGLLFGASFWIISRGLSQDNILKDYLLIAGLGFLFLFVSNSLVPAGISYPPFGTASIMFIGFSSFLVMLGIYSSAITIAEDTIIRKSIRKLAIREYRLLEGMGMAEMEEKIQKKVIPIFKEQLQNEQIPPTVKEEDIKTYISDVIKEINAAKIDNTKTDEKNKHQ